MTRLDQTFFLAANSGQGFASLYDGFPGEGAFLHIVKGGPGTGKSGFLKRIRAAAQAEGLDTESILCSGDPDSLDGLYVPAIGQAWVDGTAPHVTEPGVFGADSDYVNLGRFCRLPLQKEDRGRAAELNRSYKARYAEAYRWLAAAALLAEAEERADPVLTREAEAQADAALAPFPVSGESCRKRRRFVSAISCRGELRLDDTVNLLCKQIYYLRGGPAALAYAAEQAERRGGELILCPNPLRPERLEAVLAPALGLAFLAAPAPLAIPEGERCLSRETTARAVQALRDAKALHDALEAVYRPYMDFEGLTAFTDSCLEELFGA